MVQHLGLNDQLSNGVSMGRGDDRIGWNCVVCQISIATIWSRGDEWMVWYCGLQGYWDKTGFSSREEACRFLRLRAFD